MAKTSKGDIFIATESGEADVDGVIVRFYRGVTRVREGHPVLAAHPTLFKPIDVHYDVEDATAEPGKKRGE